MSRFRVLGPHIERRKVDALEYGSKCIELPLKRVSRRLTDGAQIVDNLRLRGSCALNHQAAVAVVRVGVLKWLRGECAHNVIETLGAVEREDIRSVLQTG